MKKTKGFLEAELKDAMGENKILNKLLEEDRKKREELERINEGYERDLERDSEMIAELQARVEDAETGTHRALRIIAKLTGAE